MTTKEYLSHLYGNRVPGKEEENAWTLALVEMCSKSSLFTISNFFLIPDKNNQLVPMYPFAMQAIIAVCLRAQQNEGIPRRVIGYKSRQVGSSSWMLAESVQATGFQSNQSAMFLVPDEDVVAKMSSRMGSMINNLPRFLQAMRRIHNQKHVVFENPNPKERFFNPGLNSEIQITVPSGMRGIPPRMLTVSEYSHMKEQDQHAISSAIIPAMADSEHTLIFVDTTPNGFDDYYYPLVMEAVEANPKWIRRLEMSPRSYSAKEIIDGAIGSPENLYGVPWIVAFERWDWHEEYTVKSTQHPRGETKRPPKKIWDEFVADLGKAGKYGGEEENDLRGRYGVTPEQLYWRRRKINSYKMPTQDMALATFHQEFAMSIEGGFVELDKTPFDRDCLEALVRQRRDPIATGLFDRDDKGNIGIRHSLGQQWHNWNIYAPPDPQEKYGMGVDTCLAYESPDSDLHAVAIMRYSDYKLVAIYAGRCPEHILREQLYLAYQFYNRPYYGIEALGMGYSLVRSCIKIGMGNYYRWQRLDKEFPEPSAHLGWQTDDRTRPLMDTAFIERLCHRNEETNKAEPQIIIPDADTLKEIQGIRRDPSSGRLKHQHGKDDRFDAICICLMMFEDPFGGFHKKKADAPTPEQRYEFDVLFKKSMPRAKDRNRPSFVNL